MITAIYGIVLLVFWLRALNIEPSRYPHVAEDIVLAWRAHKLNLYRRYAGFLLIWIVLIVMNSVLYHRPQYRIYGKWLIVLSACFMVGVLVYIAFQAYQNYLYQRKHKL